MLVLVLFSLHRTIAFEFDSAEEFLSPIFKSTLKSSPGFVAAMARLQHMKWSLDLKRIPEFVALKTYLDEVGANVDYALISFRYLEDNVTLDDYGESDIKVQPSFQPFMENVFSKVSKPILMDAISIKLANDARMKKFCERTNGYYVRALLNMMEEQHHGKRIRIDFLMMDLNLEEVAELLVEIVSVACVEI